MCVLLSRERGDRGITKKANKKMELTTKAEPILGEFKDLGRLLWQLILALSLSKNPKSLVLMFVTG